MIFGGRGARLESPELADDRGARSNLRLVEERRHVVIDGADGALAEDERVKKLTRVAREDRTSRLDGLANLVATLLTRPPMVAELTTRGLDEAALEALRADADASSRAGKNIQLAAAATERERTAVKTQTALWSSLRRMIRKAVQGDPALERLYAQCSPLARRPPDPLPLLGRFIDREPLSSSGPRPPASPLGQCACLPLPIRRSGGWARRFYISWSAIGSE